LLRKTKHHRDPKMNPSELPILNDDDVLMIGSRPRPLYNRRLPPSLQSPPPQNHLTVISTPETPPPLPRQPHIQPEPEPEPEPETSSTVIPELRTNTRKCGHCREVGHIVSHCPVIRNAAKSAMDYYLLWITVVVVDYFVMKWNYSEEMMKRFSPAQKQQRNFILCSRMKAILNQYKNEPPNIALTSVLNALPPYLEEINGTDLVALAKAHRKNLSNLPSFSMRNIPDVKKRLHSSLLMQVDKNLVTSRVSCYYSNDHEEHWPIERQLYIEKSLQLNNILIQAVGIDYQITPRDRVRALEHMQRIIGNTLSENEYRLRNKQNELVNIEPRIRKITQRIRNLQQEISDLEMTRTRVENSRPGVQSDITKFRKRVELNSNEISRYRNIPIIPKIAFADTDADAPTILTDLCPICFEDKPVEEHCTTQCGHLFCNVCIIKHVILQYKRSPPYLKSNFSCCCPYCRADISSLTGDYKLLRSILRQACEENGLPYNDLLRAIGGRRYSAMLETIDLSTVVPVCQPNPMDKNHTNTNTTSPNRPLLFPVNYRDIVYIPC